MNWDMIAANGKMRKGKKGGRFVSRNSNYSQQVPARDAKPKLEQNRPALVIQDVPVTKNKDGSASFQTRINGKFGKKMTISASLAEKLDI